MINLGKDIYTLLKNDSTLTSYVGTKIFPILIPEQTDLPIVVYERSGSNNYNKDSKLNESTVNITVIAATYAQTVDIANAVDNILNGYQGTVNTTKIRDSRLIEVAETYENNAYFQLLRYTVLSA